MVRLVMIGQVGMLRTWNDALFPKQTSTLYMNMGLVQPRQKNGCLASAEMIEGQEQGLRRKKKKEKIRCMKPVASVDFLC